MEIERARLTRQLARMKEEEGQIGEAAEILQEVAVVSASCCMFSRTADILMRPCKCEGGGGADSEGQIGEAAEIPQEVAVVSALLAANSLVQLLARAFLEERGGGGADYSGSSENAGGSGGE